MCEIPEYFIRYRDIINKSVCFLPMA